MAMLNNQRATPITMVYGKYIYNYNSGWWLIYPSENYE